MSRPWTGPINGEDKLGSTFFGVWAVPTGGWDAAQGFWGGDMEDPGLDLTALWHSDDGLTWSVLRPAGPFMCGGCESGETPWVLAGPSGRRVTFGFVDYFVGSDPMPTLFSSLDGQDYRPVESAPLDCGEYIGEGLAPVGTGPWVFVGGRVEGPLPVEGYTPPENEAGAWSSRDLVTWTTSLMPQPAGVNASVWTVARHGAGYVATGGDLTWLSDDGATWRLADVAYDHDSSIGEIANGPAGTLGFASLTGNPGDRIDVFRLSDVR